MTEIVASWIEFAEIGAAQLTVLHVGPQACSAVDRNQPARIRRAIRPPRASLDPLAKPHPWQSAGSLFYRSRLDPPTPWQTAGLHGRPVLVLERPVAGLPFPDWDRPLAETWTISDPVIEAVRRVGSDRALSADRIESALTTVAVYVLPWGVAASEANGFVGTRYGLPPAAAVPVVLALRNEVANGADANALARP